MCAKIPFGLPGSNKEAEEQRFVAVPPLPGFERCCLVDWDQSELPDLAWHSYRNQRPPIGRNDSLTQVERAWSSLASA